MRVRAALLDADLGFVADGVLSWDATGALTEVGTYKGGPVDEDRRGELLTPGFVDAHVHAPQTRIIGRATGPLLEWLATTTFPEEARFADDGHANDVYARFTRALVRSGTTAACVYGSSHPTAAGALFSALDAAGLRAIAGPVWMDEGAPTPLCIAPELSRDTVLALRERWAGHPRLSVAVIPRFALSCSSRAMALAGQLAADHDLLCTTHLSENVGEVQAVRERFGNDYVDVYADAGMLGRKTVLAHAIHLTERDWRRLSDAGAIIAHCPDSNAFLGSGTFPWTAARDHGVRVALGSDVAAGRSFRMGFAAAYTYDNALRDGATLAPIDLFGALTRDASAALGLPGGRLALGLPADVVAWPMPPWADDADAVLATLLFDADAPVASATWISGRRVWTDDGRPWWSVVREPIAR